MQITKLKTGGIYEGKYSYSRAIVVDNWIVVSNTAGRNYATREIGKTALEQAERALINVEAALKAAGSSLADVVRSRVAIPNVDEVAGVLEYLGTRFAGVDPALTVYCTPLAGPDYLFEIEVTAYRGAGSAEVETINVVI